jgi:hypothetical protein
VVELDLPAGLRHDEAVRWNAAFEVANGLVIEKGRARYTGRLYDLRGVSPALAAGFPAGEIDTVYDEMAELRARLQARASLA